MEGTTILRRYKTHSGANVKGGIHRTQAPTCLDTCSRCPSSLTTRWTFSLGAELDPDLTRNSDVTIELIGIHTVSSDSEWVLLLVPVWNVGVLVSRLTVNVHPHYLTLCFLTHALNSLISITRPAFIPLVPCYPSDASHYLPLPSLPFMLTLASLLLPAPYQQASES
ncbi:hypothetical protein PILCRDRAFT_293812 [Piloderma croceum F 1598]|uniref:Uncharacterized protein n=1 Tax=Piloderma croceum (strain F 1598) TaxID=765440 RepID=A0A0C3G8L0_PILCF|nr:hypothetical protein PILCRDRAFT_293812 [Piloderma croceum F 1598]